MNEHMADSTEPVILSARPERDEYWFREGCHITELSNSASDESVSIARVRLPPGGQTRWHALTGTVERYVILAGTGVVEVGDMPDRVVSENDVVIIPAGIRQRIRNPGQQDLEFLAICSPRFQVQSYRDLE